MPLVIQLIYNLHIKVARNLLTSAILLSWADDLNVVELPDLPETEQFKKPGRKKNDVWNYFIKEEARKFDHSPSTYVWAEDQNQHLHLLCKQSNHYLQKLALYILSIVPHSASCERIFSVLNWFIQKRLNIR
ncbi:unnamed protein product [Rhizophagus irregularis]|nr:unnamed protein product [Rhizophagus irregularis]